MNKRLLPCLLMLIGGSPLMAVDAVSVDALGTLSTTNVVIARTAAAGATEAVRGDDPRLTNARPASGGDAATVGGKAPSAFVQTTEKGAANGVATLDAGGLVPAAQLGVNALPAGVVLPTAGFTPSGWLACNGAAVSRTTYAALFTAIGTTYGAGDGTTTFNVPDLRGRTIIGAGTGAGDGMSGSGVPAGPALAARSVGEFGGEQAHVLTVAEMPAHSHKLAANTTNSRSAGAPGATDSIVRGTIGAADEEYTLTKPTSPTAATLGQSSTVGSGTSHNVMQPFVVLNYIIKQ